MIKNLSIIALLIVVVVLPFLLRKNEQTVSVGADSVIVVTPHNESIRYEFDRGFRDWYRAKTGREVFVDWRVIGGTSEIARYLEGEYTAGFRNHWEKDLGRDWNSEVQLNFSDRRLVPDDSPANDTLKEAARRAFLASNVSSGIDVFFGGGTYDHNRQAQMGNTVVSRILQTHPEWFGDSGIPLLNSGEPYWDAEGRWFGAVLSSYGMIYNSDSLGRLGIENPPQNWWDLQDPRLYGEVAVCDPTKSGSITQAFEMIIQQQMQIHLSRSLEAGGKREEAEAEAVRLGWVSGMSMIRRIAGNARYFTDSSMKPSIDVSLGQAAVGMTIDFYGKFQVESVGTRAVRQRLGFLTPKGGTTISADPISLLRGSPNHELGELFIEFVMSQAGQKLWSYKANETVEGAPHRFSLRRTAIRPDLYTPEAKALMSDPDYQPYELSGEFFYHAEWTSPLFSEIRFLIKVMCLDLHPELKAAWKALIDAGFPTEATEVFDDVSTLGYDLVAEAYAPIIGSGNAEGEVALARELGAVFREQYKKAERLAKQ